MCVLCFFCILIGRCSFMPRRGWSTADVPASWIQIRARTQAAFRAHEVGSAPSAQFSAAPTCATPKTDSQFCQGQGQPRRGPGCSTEQDLHVGEGSGSVDRFHRTSGRRVEVVVGEGEAGHFGSSAPFLSNNSLLSRVLRFGLYPLLHLLSVARSWCARDGSRWTSLPDGFRFSGGHVRSQCSGHWPEIVSNQHQWEFPGVGDNQRVHKESHQFAPDPGSIPMLHARWLTRRCPDSKKRWRRWGISKGRLWTF